MTAPRSSPARLNMDQILASLAEFSSGLSYRDLPADAVTASKDRLLDALGCAIGAYDCDTAEIGRSLAGPAARKELAGRMLGSKKLAAADAAAFVNSCMIRNLDFNDTYPGRPPERHAWARCSRWRRRSEPRASG